MSYVCQQNLYNLCLLNKYNNLDHNLTELHFTHPFHCNTNIHFDIENSIDSLKFLAIKINKKHITKLNQVVIYIGASIILNINFDLLYKLSKKIYDTDFCYITLPNNFFFKNIEYLPVARFTWSPVQFLITSTDNLQYELYLKFSKKVINQEYMKLRQSDQLILINNYVHSNTRLLKYNQVDYRAPRFTGFFVETTEINKIQIFYNDIPIINYDWYALSSFIIKKDIWNHKKSKVFNIIMNKILPFEIINYIESYINDTYLYFVPVDINNPDWDKTNNNLQFANYSQFCISTNKYDGRDENIFIQFDDTYYGDICYTSHNWLHIEQNICFPHLLS